MSESNEKMPQRMMYKHPGRHEIHGSNYDYTIINDTEEEIENAKSHGWYLTTPEALANSGKDKPVKDSGWK